MIPDLPPLLLPTEHRRVWAALKGHVGRDQAVGQAELARLTDLSERRLREVVGELIVRFRQPVCTRYGGRGTAGYYLPANPQEAEEAAEALKQHALAILERASVLGRTALRSLCLDLFHRTEK